MISRQTALVAMLVALNVAADGAQETTHSAVDVRVRATFIPAVGKDLTKSSWYASADLPPDSPAETIIQLGRETTPTVILRTPVGTGSGMLFTFIDLPVPLPQGAGGRLVVGNIDGEDATYLNGELIGSTEGWGVSDLGRPRLYGIKPAVLKPGRNVLALRLRGHGGRQTFGIRPGPITFSLVSPSLESTVAPALPARSPTISRELALQAVSAVDAEVTPGSPVQQKRAGFGRFGELFHDGLPAVAEVSPTRIAQRNGVVFDLALDRVNTMSLAMGEREPGVDSWHKRTRVQASCSGQPVTYTLLSSILYPGTVITLEEGSVLQFRARFPSKTATVLPISEETMAGILPGSKTGTLPMGYIFIETQQDSTPAVLFATGLTANVTQAESHVDVTLARSGSGSGSVPGRVFLFFPKGIAVSNFAQPPVDARQLASTYNPNDPDAELRQWARIGLNEPVGATELFRVLPGRKHVRIYQVTRYAPAASLPPLPGRPPQVDFAIQSLKYPVEGPATTTTGLLTFSGEMQAQLEEELTTSSVANTYCTWYDLPIPPMHERGLLSVPVQRELRELLNRWALSDLGSTASVTGVDALYKSRTQGFQALSFLSAEKKNRLLSDSERVVPESLDENIWHQRTEPFSGLTYWWTYFIEGPYYEQFDQDWGNGLSLYGLYYYVKYASKWEFANEQWEAIERIFSWFSVTDDWEWMRASNGAHGHGTGAGDCESATYAATVAYARLAEGCGRVEEHDYGTYLAARAALFALNRFVYDDFADRHHLKEEENSMVLGFHEGRGFLIGELDGYPWNVTSAISGNGVQPENFDLYMKYAPEPLRKYQRTFDKAYPDWMSGTFKYPRSTIYRGNSGYITLPNIYLRARLQESFATLRDYLEQAAPNEYLWWLAPPVIAEVLHLKTGGVYVRDWGRSVFLGGEVNRDEASDPKRTEVLVRVDVKHSPDLLELVLPKKPVQFTVNQGPVPLTDSRFENDVLYIRLRRPGENTISVTF